MQALIFEAHVGPVQPDAHVHVYVVPDEDGKQLPPFRQGLERHLGEEDEEKTPEASHPLFLKLSFSKKKKKKKERKLSDIFQLMSTWTTEVDMHLKNVKLRIKRGVNLRFSERLRSKAIILAHDHMCLSHTINCESIRSNII